MIDPDQLADLVDLIHHDATDGIDGLDDEATAQAALLVRRGRELLDHIEVHAIGALEDSGYTDREFALTTATWLSREAGIAAETARAQVNTARMLRRHLHGTDQAWLDGTITRDHLDVFARAANSRIRRAGPAPPPRRLANAA